MPNLLAHKPLVSVCVPTIRRPRWLEQSIRSILAQTFQDFELIVLDNASGDDTEAVVRGFGDARIRYLPAPERIPKAANMNRGILASRGNIVAIYHDDDILAPVLLERSVDLLRHHANVGAVAAAAHYVEPDDPTVILSTRAEPWAETMPGQFMARLLVDRWDCPVMTPTAAVRREVYSRAGLWTDEYAPPIDRDLWIRIFQICDFGYIPEPMAWMRATTQRQRVTAAFEWGSYLSHVRISRTFIDRVYAGSPLRRTMAHARSQATAMGELLRTVAWSVSKGHEDVTEHGIDLLRSRGYGVAARALRMVANSAAARAALRRTVRVYKTVHTGRAS